jgi:hypothetical protein
MPWTTVELSKIACDLGVHTQIIREVVATFHNYLTIGGRGPDTAAQPQATKLGRFAPRVTNSY